MFREQIRGFLTSSVLLNELKQEYKDFKCCKLGIIDEQGNKLRAPVTEEEQAAYSPLTKTILKIKKYLGPKWDLIHNMLVLESESKIEYNKETHQKFLNFETRIQDLLTQLHELTNEALSEGLTLEQVESFFK